MGRRPQGGRAARQEAPGGLVSGIAHRARRLADRLASAARHPRAMWRRVVGYLRQWESGDERLLWEPAFHSRRPRVLFAGPDFRFIEIESIALRLGQLRQCEVRTLRWRGIEAAAPRTAVAANAWADVVLCEWAGANAVWHARYKRPGQRQAAAIVTAIVSGLLACCSGSSPGAGHEPCISPQAMAGRSRSDSPLQCAFH